MSRSASRRARSTQRPASPATAHLTRRLVLSGLAAVLVAILVGVGIAYVIARRDNTTTSTVSSSPIQQTSRVPPRAIETIPLVDQDGHVTDLAALHGRIVVLADFMTSCQETCPITTGALMSVKRAIDQAHLASKVSIVDVSIDSWRDTPSRLRAYQRTFGAHWTMLTGSVAHLDRLWSWFGVIYQRVAEGKPPAIDWETGRPYTFDIVHSDDLFVLDPSGHEVGVTAGSANVGGRLPAGLRRLLSAQGAQNLRHPGYGSWTPSDVLQFVGGMLGRSIPLATS